MVGKSSTWHRGRNVWRFSYLHLNACIVWASVSSSIAEDRAGKLHPCLLQFFSRVSSPTRKGLQPQILHHPQLWVCYVRPPYNHLWSSLPFLPFLWRDKWVTVSSQRIKLLTSTPKNNNICTLLCNLLTAFFHVGDDLLPIALPQFYHTQADGNQSRETLRCRAQEVPNFSVVYIFVAYPSCDDAESLPDKHSLYDRRFQDTDDRFWCFFTQHMYEGMIGNYEALEEYSSQSNHGLLVLTHAKTHSNIRETRHACLPDPV